MTDFMNKPVKSEISTAEIVDFYCRCNSKSETARVYGISVKELNSILKAARITTQKKYDPYEDVGMKRSDF